MVAATRYKTGGDDDTYTRLRALFRVRLKDQTILTDRFLAWFTFGSWSDTWQENKLSLEEEEECPQLGRPRLGHSQQLLGKVLVFQLACT